LKPVIYALSCAMACLPAMLFAQSESTDPAAANAGLPHQVGLIDMAYVFKNSIRFHSLTEELQREIERTDQEAKVLVDRIRQLQAELKQSSSEDSSSRLEEQLVKARTELESFKRVAQQSFLRKEADIYKDVYLEVEEAVRRYASYYKYTLILRFERQALSDQDDPQQVMNGMNRQVVHFQPHDDITEPVLKYVNSNWDKGPKEPSAQSAGTPPRQQQTPPAEDLEASEKGVKLRFGGGEVIR